MVYPKVASIQDYFLQEEAQEPWEFSRICRNSLGSAMSVCDSVYITLYLDRVGGSSIPVLRPTCKATLVQFWHIAWNPFISSLNKGNKHDQRELTTCTWSPHPGPLKPGMLALHMTYVPTQQQLACQKYLAHTDYIEVNFTHDHFFKTGRNSYFV